MEPILHINRPVFAAPLLALLFWFGFNHAAQPRGSGTAISDPQPEIAALRSEIDHLKGVVPDQSHAMKDVAYHFANLWFAAQRTNWPLAEFYWSETRSHLRWAVRIIPVRKDPQGNDLHLSEILDPIEKGPLQQVGDAIGAKESTRFANAYKQMLDSCYACHLAAGKTFLRLRIPERPEASIIRFDPAP